MNNNGWISVADKLPQLNQQVIVYQPPYGVNVFTYVQDDPETADVHWEDEYGHWRDADTVSHWMPLPEEPMEEKP